MSNTEYTQTDKDQQDDTQRPLGKEQPFVEHLRELRDRLIQIVLVFLVCFVVAFFVWKDIYAFLSGMIETTVKIGGKLVEEDKWINISPAGGIFTAIKISMSTAFFIAMPFIFFHLWRFAAPGLYAHEKKLVAPIILGGTVLFYLGILFARYVILPIFFVFAETFIPPNTSNTYDILQYLNFTLSIFFAFGIAFQVPIVTIVLVWSGISSPKNLRAKRPYVIVGVFVVGMLLTPPDMISQTLLAIPMWLLFELGIVLSVLYYRPDEDDDEEDNDSPNDKGPDDSGPEGGAPSTSAAKTTQAANDGVDGSAWDKSQDTKAKDNQASAKAKNEMDDELDRFEAEMNELERKQYGHSFTDDIDTPENNKQKERGHDESEQQDKSDTEAKQSNSDNSKPGLKPDKG